jgi:hypothetical protein
MPKTTNKNQRGSRKHHALLAIVSAALLISLVILAWAAYRAQPPRDDIPLPVMSSKVPYVDGPDAVAQVANFYSQYIDAHNIQKVPGYHDKLIAAYGNSNLVFYSQYYDHGFDPITCSTVMPQKVTASLVATGPVATVNAVAEYPDDTKSTIIATVVLHDALQIDTITCPGAKGHLPPERLPAAGGTVN